MKVTLQEHGGFAALQRRPHSVDSGALSTASAADLERLTAAAVASGGGAPGGAVPDEMVYEITIERLDGRIVLTGADSSMTPEFRALLRWMRARSSK